jgi:hypothetical protein
MTILSLLQAFLFGTLSLFLLLLSIAIVVHCIKALLDTSRWYIPRMDITVSTDGGTSYHNNLAAIPGTGVFYLCFNISVRLISPLLCWLGQKLSCCISVQHAECLAISLYECSNLYPEQESADAGASFPRVFILDPCNRNKKVSLILRCQFNETPIKVFPVFAVSIKKKHKGKRTDKGKTKDYQPLFQKIVCPGFVDLYGNPIRGALIARPRCFCDD